MSGLWGVARFVRPSAAGGKGDEASLSRDSVLEAMAGRALHRGSPEIAYRREEVGIGVWLDRKSPDASDGDFPEGEVRALGVRRGAVDLRTGRYALFDGRPANARGLLRYARLLSGGRLPENVVGSEAERAILALYDRFGEGAFSYLHGAFVLVLHDPGAETLYLVRDPFGVRPLFYSAGDGNLAFASELKALLPALSRLPEVNFEALLMYLTLQYVPGPFTPFREVFRLRPGHFLRFRPAGVDEVRYFAPTVDPVERTEEFWKRAIRATVERTFDAEWIPGETGVLLSSGVDSSILAALARRRGDVRTFSVCFGGPNDECPLAEATARFLGTEHRFWPVTPDEYFGRAGEAASAFDEPLGDPSAVGLYLLAGRAAEYVRKVLSGEGADEFFAGYRIYLEPAAVSWAGHLPLPVRRALRVFFRSLPGFYGKNYLLRSVTPLEERYVGNAKVFTEDRFAAFRPEIRDVLRGARDAFSWAREVYASLPPAVDDVARMQLVDLNLWLPGDILVKGERSTAAHGVQLGMPFMHFDVYRLASRVPSSFKVRGGQSKYIVRQAFRDILPPHVVDRPKLGFPVPLRDWLRQGYADRVVARIAESPAAAFLDVGYAASLAREHVEGRRDNARKLYVLYALALWSEVFLSSAARAGVSSEKGGVSRDLAL
ncbi:MAG: Asparagine synthetase [glutamine-hydrolyzing] [Brockia lithotrophica]|uniref:asparagine synthase (glutamine-hydrolyzing) n=1 Tax=Brockia lithotrophica TaxID=933949 RepID=A0A2T5G755_9BACL|nr:MAG: Asparagine synthetase [glutamine-hydrolyzing] [Brockia lithotrophica]